MDVLIITNIHERKGLYRDASIVAELVHELGHQVSVVDFRDGAVLPSDLAIHLEVVEPRFLTSETIHWWIPNPEWARSSYLKHIEKFDCVLCKTKEAERVFRSRTGRAVLTGFMSEDRRDTNVERERVFFHAYRGSEVKGTQAIVDAWSDIEYPLILAEDMDEVAYRYEQNRCLFHLCPSEYEGWGHTIHEALSVGAVVISSNIAPMNETKGIAYLVDAVPDRHRCLATFGKVSVEGIREVVDECMCLTNRQIAEYSIAARAAYERETRSFHKIFWRLVSELHDS